MSGTNLYKYFDDIPDINFSDELIVKGDGYKLITTIFNFIKNELYSCKDINTKIKQISALLPENDLDHISAEVYIAVLIIQIMIFILKYYRDEDTNYIFSITKKVKEIINQTKSDEYLKIINPNASDINEE